MKKAMSLILTATLGLSCFAACSSAPAETSAETEAQASVVETTAAAETTEAVETTEAEVIETTAAETEAAAPAVDTEVTPELNDLFEQALQGFVGVGYTPEFYLGSFDNGDTIHCFLCKSTTVTADPVSYWSFVFVLDDGAGNVSIAKVCQPDYSCVDPNDGEFYATEVQTEPVMGGWEDNMDYEVTDERYAEFSGVCHIYDPIAILATQVVEGMNYMYLVSDADGNLKMVKLYVNLDGNACVTGSRLINLETLY